MEKQNKFQVLYQSSDAYAPFAGVSITSLLENNKDIEELTIFLIDVDISSINKQKLLNLAEEYNRELVFLNIEKIITKLKELKIEPYHGSYATYLKLFIIDYLPETVDKILYIDSDTVVVGSLKELCTLKMGDTPIAAVRGCLTADYKRNLGCECDDGWYNMGVALFNVEYWKRNHITKLIQEHLHTVRAQYAVADQDLMNVIFHNKFMVLSPKYNLQSIHLAYNTDVYFLSYPERGYYTKQEISASMEAPVIVHLMRFVGEYPWHKNNVHPCNELFDLWLEKSRWNGYEKSLAKTGIVLKIEKILYRLLPRKWFLPLFKRFNNLLLWRLNRIASTKDKKEKLLEL